MNPVVKQKWVDALRSGTYSQGKAALRDGNKFCCLGVLCDLYSNTDWQPLGFSSSYFYFRETMLLPRIVQEWAGLEQPDPAILAEASNGIICYTLAFLNDEGTNFEQIAKVIEEQL